MAFPHCPLGALNGEMAYEGLALNSKLFFAGVACGIPLALSQDISPRLK